MYPLYPDEHYYGSASVLPSASAWHQPMYREPPPKPMSIDPPRATLVLPARVEDEIRAERERESREMIERWYHRPSPRPLTDDECTERFGAPLAVLCDSVTFWERRLRELPKRKRKERREAERSLAQARDVLASASSATTVGGENG